MRNPAIVASLWLLGLREAWLTLTTCSKLYVSAAIRRALAAAALLIYPSNINCYCVNAVERCSLNQFHHAAKLAAANFFLFHQLTSKRRINITGLEFHESLKLKQPDATVSSTGNRSITAPHKKKTGKFGKQLNSFNDSAN